MCGNFRRALKKLNGLSASTQALFTWRCASEALAKSCIKYKKFGVKLELPPRCVVRYVTSTHSPYLHFPECLSGARPTAVRPPQCYWPGDKSFLLASDGDFCQRQFCGARQTITQMHRRAESVSPAIPSLLDRRCEAISHLYVAGNSISA